MPATESKVIEQPKKSWLKRAGDFLLPHRVISVSALSNITASAVNTFGVKLPAQFLKIFSGVGMNVFHTQNIWKAKDKFTELNEKLNDEKFSGSEKAEELNKNARYYERSAKIAIVTLFIATVALLAKASWLAADADDFSKNKTAQSAFIFLQTFEAIYGFWITKYFNERAAELKQKFEQLGRNKDEIEEELLHEKSILERFKNWITTGIISGTIATDAISVLLKIFQGPSSKLAEFFSGLSRGGFLAFLMGKTVEMANSVSKKEENLVEKYSALAENVQEVEKQFGTLKSSYARIMGLTVAEAAMIADLFMKQLMSPENTAALNAQGGVTAYGGLQILSHLFQAMGVETFVHNAGLAQKSAKMDAHSKELDKRIIKNMEEYKRRKKDELPTVDEKIKSEKMKENSSDEETSISQQISSLKM